MPRRAPGTADRARGGQGARNPVCAGPRNVARSAFFPRCAPRFFRPGVEQGCQSRPRVVAMTPGRCTATTGCRHQRCGRHDLPGTSAPTTAAGLRTGARARLRAVRGRCRSGDCARDGREDVYNAACDRADGPRSHRTHPRRLQTAACAPNASATPGGRRRHVERRRGGPPGAEVRATLAAGARGAPSCAGSGTSPGGHAARPHARRVVVAPESDPAGLGEFLRRGGDRGHRRPHPSGPHAPDRHDHLRPPNERERRVACASRTRGDHDAAARRGRSRRVGARRTSGHRGRCTRGPEAHGAQMTHRSARARAARLVAGHDERTAAARRTRLGRMSGGSEPRAIGSRPGRAALIVAAMAAAAALAGGTGAGGSSAAATRSCSAVAAAQLAAWAPDTAGAIAYAHRRHGDISFAVRAGTRVLGVPVSTTSSSPPAC